MKPVDINVAGLVGSRQLAGILGIDLSTLCQWTNEKADLRKARIRRGVYAVRELRAAGYIQEKQARP